MWVDIELWLFCRFLNLIFIYLCDFDVQAIDLLFCTEIFGTEWIWFECTFGLHGFVLLQKFNFHFMFAIVWIRDVFWLFEDLTRNFAHWIGKSVSQFADDTAIFSSVSFWIQFGIVLFHILVWRCGKSPAQRCRYKVSLLSTNTVQLIFFFQKSFSFLNEDVLDLGCRKRFYWLKVAELSFLSGICVDVTRECHWFTILSSLIWIYEISYEFWFYRRRHHQWL